MNFIYEFSSFIELNDFGGYVSITDSTFSNFNTCGSLIRKKDRIIYSNPSLAQTSYSLQYHYRANNYYS